MKVALVESAGGNRPVNKDQMSGLGLVTTIGTGPLARVVQRQMRRRVPILTLGYLAAIFARHGHDLHVVTDGEPVEADLTVIYSSIVEVHSEVAYARAARAKGGRVIVVGPFATHVPEAYAADTDAIIKGEPEVAIEEIAKRGSATSGVIDSRPLTNLDELPIPNWAPFRLDRYSYYPVLAERPFVTIQASRGCSFKCAYCPYMAFFGDVRRRSVPHVMAEVDAVVERHGVRALYFRDPLFTHDRAWTEECGRALARRSRPVTWGCETRMELLDESLIDLLHDAGLRAINTGIESADPRVLKTADRANGFRKMERMIAHCERRGIKVLGFYVLGLPGDDRASIEETIQYAQRLNTFGVKFHLSTPFPGTPFYEQVRDQIFDSDWEHFDSSTPVFHHGQLSHEELLALKERAYVSYYFRPTYFRKHYRALVNTWRRGRAQPR